MKRILAAMILLFFPFCLQAGVIILLGTENFTVLSPTTFKVSRGGNVIGVVRVDYTIAHGSRIKAGSELSTGGTNYINGKLASIISVEKR